MSISAPGTVSTGPSAAIGGEAIIWRFLRRAASSMARSAGLLSAAKSMVGWTRGSTVLARTLPRLRGLRRTTKVKVEAVKALS